MSSFDWNLLLAIHKLNHHIPIGILTETNLDIALAFAEEIKATAIHPHFHLLNEENSERIHQKGFLIFPWTINEPKDIERIKKYKRNGIITDFPERI